MARSRRTSIPFRGIWDQRKHEEIVSNGLMHYDTVQFVIVSVCIE